MASSTQRPIRVGGVSGGFSDRFRASHSLTRDDVDVIVRDWLSEMIMTMYGTRMIKSTEKTPATHTFEETLSLLAEYQTLHPLSV
jgi:hypothetical protein